MKKLRLVCLVLVLAFVCSAGALTYVYADDSNSPKVIADKQGDINGDGACDEKDYHLLEKYFAKYDMSKVGTFNEEKCDYNKDSKIDLFDLYEMGDNVIGAWSPLY